MGRFLIVNNNNDYDSLLPNINFISGGDGNSGGSNGHEEHSESHFEVVCGILCLLIYILCGHTIDYFSKKGYIVALHESAIAVIIGAACGILILQVDNITVTFNTDIFWYLVLPPIIFAEGYTLKKRNFFKYSEQIFMYGLLGTLITFTMVAIAGYYVSRWVWIWEGGCRSFDFFGIKEDNSEEGCLKEFTSMEALLLSAVLSASDEVSALAHIKPETSPKMGSILFGEGVINDAVSILLFKTCFSKFVEHVKHSQQQHNNMDMNIEDDGVSAFLMVEAVMKLALAISVGIGCGLIASVITFRFESFKKDHIRESCIVLIFGYLSYGLGELLECSGILALFFCSTTLAHYCWHNLSLESRTATRTTFHIMAMICEGISFVYVGISAMMKGPYSFRFCITMFIILCVSRLMMIFGLTAVLKCTNRNYTFTWKEQLGLSCGGMVRGSIAWAQALLIGSYSHPIMTTTLVVVLMSTLLFGVILPPIIKILGVAGGGEDDHHHISHQGNNDHHGGIINGQIEGISKEINNPTLHSSEVAGSYSGTRLYQWSRSWIKSFDDRYMKHQFGGRIRGTNRSLQSSKISTPHNEIINENENSTPFLESVIE